MNKIFLTLMFFFTVTQLIFSASNELGHIEWTENGPIVITKGIGAINHQLPLAVQRPAVIEAAKIDGLRKALEIIKGININSETTIENKMLTDDIIIKNVSGVIKFFEVGEPHYYSDGTVEVEVRVPLAKNKELLELFFPKNKENTTKNQNKNVDKNSSYTGIIINAIDLGVIPALMIKIKSKSGKIIFSEKDADKEAIFEKSGMAAYVVNKSQALKAKDRIGENPVIINAIAGDGKYKTDIIVSDKDAKILEENIDLLKKCALVIITNSL